METGAHLVVVGAGVIGAAVAHELQDRGFSVTLVDANAPGLGASFGNMASIAVTEFMPVSRPAVWAQVPGWLLDPEGPIRIAPGYAPRLLPWFVRFLRAGTPNRVREVEAAGAALCRRALVDTEALLKTLGLERDLSASGCLSLYASEAEFGADRARLEMLDRHGFGYDVLDQAALHDLEPEIASDIQKAVLLPDNRTLRDPHALVVQLVQRFTALGGSLQRARVAGFDRAGRINAVRLEDGTSVPCDAVVLAAGAFTGALARMLGEPIPLETERGYHTQINAPGIELKHSIIWPAKAFMVSPTAGGIRVGGTVEMAGLDAPPDWRRAKITVRHAREALPALQEDQTSEWRGHRPALPDTIPIISASAKTPGVFYATGHGHLGLTHAATTAKLVGQLITGQKTEIDLTAYRVGRF